MINYKKLFSLLLVLIKYSLVALLLSLIIEKIVILLFSDIKKEVLVVLTDFNINLVFLCLILKKEDIKDFFEKKIRVSIKFLFFLVITTLFLFILVHLLGNFLVENFEVFKLSNKKLEYRFQETKWMIFSILFVGPFFEEVIYRGIILEKIKKFSSKKFAILVSTFIFSIFHGYLVQIILTFFVGLYFGYIYSISNSIKLCIFSHFVYNFIVSTFYYFDNLYMIDQRIGLNISLIILFSSSIILVPLFNILKKEYIKNSIFEM